MHASVVERFWEKVDRSGGPDACWPWTGRRTGNGYGAFDVRRKARPAHRLAYELTNGPLPPGSFACHRCDTPLCCNPAHLFAGSHADNMADMKVKGRGRTSDQRSGANGHSRLTPEQITDIRRRYATGHVRQVDLAAEFGITQAHISSIVRGVAWREVTRV